MKYHKAQTKEAIGGLRSQPEIPSQLPEIEGAVELVSDRDIAIQECALSDFKAGELNEKTLRFECCVLTRVSFSNSRLIGMKLKDVQLVECDFANTTVLRMVALRVEFQNCRLTGFRANECDFQHTLISSGDAGYSQFRMGKFKSSVFEACNFSDADFHDADLRGTVIQQELEGLE